MVEIDLIIMNDRTLYPIEIKKYTNFNVGDMKSFVALNKIKDMKIGKGGIICMNRELIKLENGNYIIPVNYI